MYPLQRYPICMSLVSGATHVSHSGPCVMHGHLRMSNFDPFRVLISVASAMGLRDTRALWNAGIVVGLVGCAVHVISVFDCVSCVVPRALMALIADIEFAICCCVHLPFICRRPWPGIGTRLCLAIEG